MLASGPRTPLAMGKYLYLRSLSRMCAIAGCNFVAL